jgi:murein DD-endopeptidase MepM/ murein hydrolase activator NlpD
MQREAVVAARAAPASSEISLVGADIRALVEEIESRYDDFRLSDLRMPIVGATLPDLDTLMPGAPRAYRNGIHQGFDMNNGHIGVPTAYSGPVVAAKDGTVIRATLDFQEMTLAEHADAIAASQAAGTTPPDILDKLRGRQVWIDHGHGIVTRYVHLSGIASDVVEGGTVRAGDIVGFVGNSGTEAGVQGTRGGAHLHFELRIDDRYFGEGMSYSEIREQGNRIFGIEPRD